MMFVLISEKLNELVEQLEVAGKCIDEVENIQLFQTTINHIFVEKIVSSPKILYLRVRAVFALCGNMVNPNQLCLMRIPRKELIMCCLRYWMTVTLIHL